MQHIYAYLKSVLQNIILQHQQNKLFWPLTLLISTVPLSLGINNVILIISGLTFILIAGQHRHQLTFAISLPISLFLWMLIVTIWSIDIDATLSALPREIGLLVIPIFFIRKNIFSDLEKNRLIKYYSLFMLLLVIFWLVRAVIRYMLTQNPEVFFYHELVTEKLNAIHVSVYVSIAYFYFLEQKNKTIKDWGWIIVLLSFITLLSSKNILAIVLLLSLIYFIKNKIHLGRNQIILFTVLIILLFGLFSIKIIDRYLTEINANTSGTSQTIAENKQLGIRVLTINNAWTNEKFSPNDYFTGTAFRVYQFRLFLEFLQEEPIFWTGFGLDASYKKLEEKAVQYDVYRGDSTQKGYHQKNFHNQYIQNFVELGFFGFVILILMMGINLKNGILHKDFLHIAFAVLMISLFLTESFLWRQRGVVFFSFLYCLFNSNYSLQKFK